MTYVVLHRPEYSSLFAWTITDHMGHRYGADSQVEALALTNMLNMLTPDQRNAAAVEAVAQWKDTTDAA